MNIALPLQTITEFETYLIYYLVVGGVFAIFFVFIVVNLIDEHARAASVGFRIIIFPASMLLWPLVMPICLAKLFIAPRIAIQKRQKQGSKSRPSSKEKISKSIRIATDKPSKTSKKVSKVAAKPAIKKAKPVPKKKSPNK
ncbi:MAG: hypothetical protein HAW61_00245 [Candidatus Portiera sp.]|nr:hypothetical protein [Portiera sp.]